MLPDQDEDNGVWLEQKLAEARELLKNDPMSHELRGEVFTMELWRGLMKQGTPLWREGILRCLERMRDHQSASRIPS